MGPQGPPGSGGASCKLVNKREFEFKVSHHTFQMTINKIMLPLHCKMLLMIICRWPGSIGTLQ